MLQTLALALRDLNEPELAAVAWVARAQAFPEDPDAMAKAARAYLDAGNSDEARGWMDLLISNHPDHPELEQLRLDYAETQRR